MERTPISVFLPGNNGFSRSYKLDTSQPLMDINNNTNSSIIHENHELNTENWEITSYTVLGRAKKLLLEDDIDDNINDCSEEAALQSVEKSFYDVLGNNNPPSPNNTPPNRSQVYSSYTEPFLGSANDNQIQSFLSVEFERGIEEGLKFLPIMNTNQFNNVDLKIDDGLVGRELEEGEDEDVKCVRYNGKRRADYGELANSEGRKYKISVLHFKDSIRDELFHKVFFLHGENYKKEVIRLSETMRMRMNLYMKDKINEDPTDLRALLIHCSRAISINDTTSAGVLIKSIRKHSSPCGNAAQRVAHVFVNGLEARLYGTTVKLYKKHREYDANILKAYHIDCIANPFTKAFDYFSNQTILRAIGKASKLHIIYFGANFGFRWSSLIQALSQRKEESPKLRITAIHTHVPSEQIEEVSRRLHDYARQFNVSFEYKNILTNWDEICIGDLNIEKDEVVIVHCVLTIANIRHKSDMMCDPKDHALDIIRQIEPHVFIQGITNSSLDGDLFTTRFKHAVLHYSAVFDLLDMTIPRENKQRQFIENDFLASFIYNVIACEGSERIERLETYKQWHVRILRAGFKQVPLDNAMIKELRDTVMDVYSKGFLVEDDNEWVLLGWKGRILHAISSWRPAPK